MILKYFFLRLVYAWRTPQCAPCAPHVRQAWRRWLSVLQLGVLKLAGAVAEWVLRYYRFLGTVATLGSFLVGKIGDSYSLEVATTAHVTFFFELTQAVTKNGNIYNYSPIFLGYSPEISRLLKYLTNR